MRKIEKQMISAIKSRRDWRNDNTKVWYSPSRNVSCVYLHNNLIATISRDEVEIYDGGWRTNTTKSRLNAIINGLCHGPTQGVYQRDFAWYIHDEHKDGRNVIPFQHGYTFARIQ